MPKKKTSKTSKSRAAKQASAKAGARCGLCGKTKNLTRTECCGSWICDDEHTYQLFSYARNSCSRNHRRYTLCGYHFNEGHPGDWKDCPKCRESFETEMYRFPVVVAPQTYAFAAAVTTIAATLSGLLVRRRLDRLNLVEVLKTRE